MASAGPASREPTGAPRPLDRQTAHDVGDRAVLRERRPGRDVRVPEPGAVEVHPGAGADGELAQVAQVLQRQHRSPGEVVRVLDRDRRGRHEEGPHVGREHRGDRRQVDLPARVRPGAHRQPADGGVRAELGPGDVRRGLAEHLLAGRDERADREDVGHRAGRGEQRRLVAEQARDPLLERPDRRVLAVDVVAHLGAGHRGPHRLGGLRQGVRAEVDHRANLVGARRTRSSPASTTPSPRRSARCARAPCRPAPCWPA